MAEEVDDEEVVASAASIEEEEVVDDEQLDENVEMLKDTRHAIASVANKRARGANLSMSSQMENLRERLNKFKELRTLRLSVLQLPHRHVIEMAACLLGIEVSEVMDGVIDSDAHVQMITELCDKGSRYGIFIFYHTDEAAPIETGRYTQFVPGLKEKTERRIFVTDGLTIPFKEKAVLIYKVDDKELEMRNIGDDLFMTKLNLPDYNNNLVSAIFEILKTLINPNMQTNKDWGELSKTDAGLILKREFIGDFQQFYNFIESTRIDLDGIIKFNYSMEFYNANLSTSAQLRQTATKIEHVRNIEATVRSWAKVMERVLTQFQQLRRENEFVGPVVEIEYWRRQLAKFTSIVEFLKCDVCVKHIQLLTQAKSKFLKKWYKHDNAVTDARNECQDNVKYLYALEQYWQPLYRCDPSKIPDHIPPLLYAIRMVYTTSRYYNNTGNVTAILVKVSNRMIQACRSYLNKDGKVVIWRQPRAEIMAKFKVCLDLYLKYYQCFKHVLAKMENEGESPFECSEMYVFGKFETFKRRIEEIIDVIEITTKYSILASSTIEGIDEFANLFRRFYLTISSQTYDVLNHRLETFSKDYDEFKQNVADTEYDLEEFVGISLENYSDVDNILRLLARFEKLDLECMHLDERYLEAFTVFQTEIEDIRDRYNEDRQRPPLPKNIPPVSGRIMWIRQLYRRIEGPMRIFQKKHRIMRHRKAQKCIQMYNALATVFIHYEQIYHDAWFDHLYQVRNGLGSPILMKHPKSRRFIVNFDPYVIEAIRESEYMYKLHLEVPDAGKILVFCKDKILESYELIKNMIKRHDSIKENIPKLFIPLLKLTLIKMENIFLPGFSTITWTSMKIPEFCDEISKFLDTIEVFVKEVTDIKEARIDEIVDSISQISLVYLPTEPLSPTEFYRRNVEYRESIVKEIEQKSATAEKAVVELINKFMDAITDPGLQDGKYEWLDPEKVVKPVGSSSKLVMADDDALFKEIDRNQHIDISTIRSDCVEMFAYFNMNMTDALVKCTKSSLEKIKKRAAFTVVEDSLTPIPIMESYMELQIPINLINPSLEQVQQHFAYVLNNIVYTHKDIVQWGQRYAHEKYKKRAFNIAEKDDFHTAQGFTNYYKTVSEHKEIVRIFMSLQGVMYVLKPDILKLLECYLDYSYLWVEDRDEQIAEYCLSNPLVVEIAERFKAYDERAADIQALPDYHDVGALRVNMESYKLALLVESNAWKHVLGKLLMQYYKERLMEIIDFIKQQEKILAKPIKDLDDCRLAMKCLEIIRENFIDMDMQLETMEAAYATFVRFKIDVPKEDIERIDTLRFNFTTMVNNSKAVQEQICLVQGPLQDELTAGVATFMQDVLDFDVDFELNGPMVPGLEAREASDRVLMFQARFDELWRKFEMYSSGERLFGLQVKDYPILHKRKKEFNLLNKLYGLYITVNTSIDGYFDLLWVDVDTEVIMAELAEFQNRCRKLPKGMKDWPAFIDLKNKIDDFNETCPLLELMANKAMKERHWQRIAKVCHYDFAIDSPTFCLKDVMEAPLLKYKDDVEDICISAVKEKDIEAKLKQVIADWAVVELSFSTFKARGELLIKGIEVGEIIATLEDSLMVMNSLLSNRYNAPFKKEIQLWVTKLVNTSEVLEKWLQVQNLWVYLEAVFVGGDIARQLPGEAKRFLNIDKNWVKIMLRAHEIPNAVECCTVDDTMLTLLPYLLEQLETCQKSLTGYLESKRLCFPRFFFISDPVLLEILGQSSDPQSIQPHLLSLFDAVYKVDFDPEKTDAIVAMRSDLNETIPFEKPVFCVGGVELWLNSLLSTVRDTVKTVIAVQCQCLKEADYDYIKGFVQSCGQAGLVGVQVLWTKEAEYAIKKSKIDKLIMKTTNKRFLDLLNGFIDLTTKDLSKLERIRFETMVTIHVHQRDIFDDIVRLKIKNYLDFEWQKQARFYYNEDNDEVVVKITDVIFLYQNEYLGVTERLAITPLTDRCYITLAQAIWMNMGGAPAGPAGTGKTETTKDMGRTLGKFVVVFNCSDQMDFRGLGRIFKGLAQSGTWGCFDEFNRIELPVLSVAAQQIYIVLLARKERKAQFIFSDGDIVTMNMEFGIFLTMNPGYAGRQELPENLKIMFRSVAMMVPDRQIIIRVKLASCGFKENVPLSRKFYTLYKLCEEQLSKQVHYDFGLRNILSCLRTMGAQKREHPNDTEETTLMRVLRDMNLSKLVDEDEPLFLSLIEDMFPGIRLTSHSWKDLQKAISNQTALMGYINYPTWNLKILQLFETSLVRHGLMSMGPTGAGKTSSMHCLMRSLTEMGKPHKELRMNPKAITAPQMFGRLDVATNDWTDGIFSTLWRRTLRFKKTDYVWLVLDGPVDAVWIENLNSVLDDNKTLTLANGDRIVMAPNCKLVFEPDNVDNASPATVSRMGMVFLSSSVLPWSPLLQAWLQTRSTQENEVFKNCFNKIYDDMHTFVQTKLKPKMSILEALYIRQCYDLLQGIIEASTEENRTLSDRHLENLFLFSCMWSLGAVLELEDRVKLEEYVVKHPSRMSWPKPKENETIFEFVVNDSGRWQHWSERVEEFFYPPDQILEYASILVPNVDNVRTTFLIDTIAKQGKAVLLIGEQGTAKTVMIKAFTNQYDPEFKLFKAFNFSSATTPNMVQRIIESYVDKRVGTTYGPPAGKILTIFIDDINMPVINAWGDQVTNEIVRQLMEQNGFYSLDKPGDFSNIVDVQFLAAMIHPGGGRNDIPNRLKRQYNIFNCTLPSTNSMDQIFTKIGTGYFCVERFHQIIVDFIPRLIVLTRHVWQNTKVKMLPTPAKFHYVFNLRDLSRIWQGITYITDPEIPNITTLLQLWQHECTRVISDRFTSEEDRAWFLNNMKKCVAEELPDVLQYFDPEPTYFVDFLKDPPEATGDEPDDFDFSAPKIYQKIPSWEFTKERLVLFLEGYNENVRGGKMDLVFFLDAMIHLCINSRIIRTPRGNCMQVGVGGSGKQSVTKLSSFIANYKHFQIQLTRSYNNNNLMDDLKYLYRVAGFEGSGITFIFTDNDIKEETFLEYLNNVLSSGEIANLFAKDELDEIQSELIPIMKKAAPKRIPTNDNLYDFFISRARNNLHLVLCFSPVSDKFRSRALKFPGLISGVTMDWYFKWPMDALIEVSQHILLEFPIVCTPETKQELILMTAEMHDHVGEICINYFDRFRRQTFVTPKTFLSFLASYKVLYKQKHEEIEVLAVRMKTGLGKLVEAGQSVDLLRKELAVKEKEIIIATNEAEKVLNIVMEASEVANKIKEEATVVKEKAEVLVANISVDQQEAEKKLMAAKPALDAAEQALLTIKAADIATVRKLGKPPHLIMLIMDAVLIYFKKKLEPTQVDFDKRFVVTSWTESLRIMADTKFLTKLQEYPKDQINAEILDLLVPYFEFPQYNYDAAKTACGNVAGLISWTIAMASFYLVNKDVLPLKANLVRQQAKLDKAQVELNTAMKLLQTKEAEVKQCQEKYDTAMTLKQAVLDDANKVKSKMDAATALINGLGGERIRWTEQSAQFKAETERLVGDVLVLTGFLGYTGPFNQEFRALIQKEWYKMILEHKIPVSSNINVVDSLADTATIGEWNLQGLPTDELSIQNGIIVTSASRFALLIDPQNQGKNWIKNKEFYNELIVTALNHKYFRNHIEDAVTLGRPLLVEDVGEELDPVLDNVLEKNLIKVGTMYKVKIGDKEVDYMKGFRMYITTKLANPAYTPEIFARTSIIDFTVTMKGLEDQLLGRVILSERRELETERTNLLKDVTANKRKIGELEQNLLYKLTTTQGNLVEDESLIGVLNITKNTASEVREKLTVAKDTEIKINAAREEFRPIATRGSVLYFLITTMAMVNCMYQTSLVQFLERFDISMARSDRSNILSKRITNIIEYLTFEIFKYKSRGLYEKDKYMFVLMMALRIDLQRHHISHEEFQVFIKGGAALDLNAVTPKPAKWILDMTWLNIVELSKLRHYQYLVTQVINNEKGWKSWFDKDAPEEAPLPDGYGNLDIFRKLLLIRAWCPDRTLNQSKKYIASSLGPKYAEPVILNLAVMLEESRPMTPIICFLSTGADPSAAIEQLAKKMENRVKSMSMGQGQEVHARKIMSEAFEEGFWALLQNTHLGLDYMEEVLLQFQEMEKMTNPTHPDFRLWITTEVHCEFPIGLLQMCIKFTNEPPSGIRAGLLRTYTAMSQDMLDYSDQPEYIPLVYAISFLHTVVQERRKFGPLGWNIPYEFNSADWLASCMFIQNHLDDLDPNIGISWTTIRYMLGEVQYGGRVTDDFDKRLLNTFAKVWFSDKMFGEDFNFYKGYKIYKFKQVADYIQLIETFSGSDPPQAYGLHPNADITYSSNTTNNMLQTILSIQPKDAGSGGGESRESKVSRACIEMLSKLPPSYDPFEVKERLRIMGNLNPLNIFLRQEIDRMQKVIRLVRSTLKDLLLAIEGTIIMNDNLRDALDNIYDARVPGMWISCSWTASSIGFWFTEVLDRDTQFRTWCYGGRPVTFWMTGFFNPQGFLTAMRQEVARAHKGWALDSVVLHNEVTKNMREEVKAPPAEGVYVYGLFLDGAGWERRRARLAESINKVLYTQMPVIHITAIFSNSPKDPKLYVCPVYKKPHRTDLTFITPLWLCTVKPPDHWILRGVALLCDTT